MTHRSIRVKRAGPSGLYLGMTIKLLACVLLSACAVDELSTVTSALSDPDRLPDVPGVPTPPGYGHYCSIVDPTNGGWMLGALASNRSDPCSEMANQVGPNAIVKRAGLYALEGNNQVMVRCDGGMVTGRIWGEAVISWITSQIDRAAAGSVRDQCSAAPGARRATGSVAGVPIREMRSVAALASLTSPSALPTRPRIGLSERSESSHHRSAHAAPAEATANESSASRRVGFPRWAHSIA
jgi:hypothetical protein